MGSLRPAWPELWPEPLGLGWTGGWRCVLSSQDRHPAGWVLPQPSLPPIPNRPPFFLLLDSWSPHLPSFQLFPVTTDPWPWTDQTSTRNKSLFQVDGVLFLPRPPRWRCRHGERWLCLPPSPQLWGRAGAGGAQLLSGTCGFKMQAPLADVTRDKLPVFPEPISSSRARGKQMPVSWWL